MASDRPQKNLIESRSHLNAKQEQYTQYHDASTCCLKDRKDDRTGFTAALKWQRCILIKCCNLR